MSKTLTLQERAEREEQVQKLIAEEYNVSDIAATLGVTTQAVRKFLKIRNWSVKKP